MRDVEVVVCDLGGVVCDFVPERLLGALAAATGRTPKDLDGAWWGRGLESRAEVGSFTPATIYDEIRRAFAVALTDERIRSLWATAFPPNDQVMALVRSIGRPTALFTNNGPVLEDCLRHELRSVGDLFPRRWFSWHLGVTKPALEAFATVTTELGVPAASILFLDDSGANVAAARRQGWVAHQITSAADLRQLLAS